MSKKYKLPDDLEYKGKWIKNWFSNMTPVKIEIDEIVFNSVENYYQAMKSNSKEIQKEIAIMSPFLSKKIGRKVIIREDWDEVKYKFMRAGLEAKFNIPEWKSKLLDTKDEEIVEWNNWNDKIWGVSIRDQEGDNLLGELLMGIRKELKEQSRKK